MDDEKHDRRDRFSWGPGDVEIIRAPETKPTHKPKPAPAAGKAGIPKDEVPPSREGEPRSGEKKG